MTELYQQSAREIARLIQQRQVKASEAVEACFQQIDRHNDQLKAVITVCRERAEIEAKQANSQH